MQHLGVLMVIVLVGLMASQTVLAANVDFESGSAANSVIKPHADCLCNRIYQPICATDSLTYSNMCEFLCAQRRLGRSGRDIRVAHEGIC